MVTVRNAAIFAAALLLAGASIAEARPGGGRGGHDGGDSAGSRHHGQGQRHYGHPHRHYRPHYRSGFFYGGWPYYDGYPGYYAPSVYVAPAVAPVYVEQPPVYVEPVPRAPEAFWYYCPSARQYYPQAQSCPEGWTRVPPSPPPG
ncbi:MAG: hypothetical protein WAO95_13100 [Burkholderiales bacterium]